MNTSNPTDHLVGKVMSSWNHFRETGPLRIARADECYVWDEEGHQRIDWIMGWGSLLLGHRPAAVIEGIKEAFEDGLGFMYESKRNGALAQVLNQLIPTAEKMRLANSGSEATLHALRIARAVTSRKLIVKFEGHFHGLNDYLLFGVDGSPQLGEISEDGLITPIAGSRGLPNEELGGLLRILQFNDFEAIQHLFEQEGDAIAAVILEPIALNVGCIPPAPGFLELLRHLCDQFGTLLIFDEVLTGFRVSPGGAQELFGIAPDLTCLGKGLGCGMPAAAVCGPRRHMDVLSPIGGVEMAGTNTGRHITVCGILGALDGMVESNIWPRLHHANDKFVEGCREILGRHGVPAWVEGYGGRVGIHFGLEERPRNFREICAEWNRAYHVACYLQATEKHSLFGFLLPLGPCPEPVTLSASHTDAVIDETLSRLDDIIKTTPYSKM